MFDFLSQIISQGFRDSPVFQELRTWAEHIAQHAPVKWIPVALSGARCECGRPAMGACVICKRVTCLGHSLVSAHGEIACFACVTKATKRGWAERAANGWDADSGPRWTDEAPKVKPPTPIDLRAKHLKTLGLKPNATMEEIRGAWKRLALKHHPDRAPERRREAAEKRMRAINEAYQWLVAHAEAA